MRYYEQNTFLSRLLYGTACVFHSFGRFLALPLYVIPERFQWVEDKNIPGLKKPNLLADFFCPMWLILFHGYLFEQSVRYDPEYKVWDNPDSAADRYYRMLVDDE